MNALRPNGQGTYDEWGRTRLINAVIDENFPLVKELAARPDMLHMPDINGSTPVIIAAHIGNVLILHHLVGLGADLRVKDTFGFDPLLRAAMAGHFESVLYLLER
ncbi:ankyrin repeat domain-containing protein, partial [Myxococcota bacterium]|nr:ankyrin repeat domain-containing protein [Myxococcota bacterium]